MLSKAPARLIFRALFPQPTSIYRTFCAPKINPDIETQIMEVTRNFLEGVKKADLSKLDRKSKFEELGLDSLDTIDLIVELEEALGIDLSNEDAENRIKGLEDACIVFTEYKVRKDATAESTN